MSVSKSVIISFVLVLFFCFSGISLAQDTADKTVGTVESQTDDFRDMTSYTCKDVMRNSGCSRDIGIAVLHAYFMGKSGKTKFDIQELSLRTDLFIEHCLDNPKDIALDVMEKLSKDSPEK